MLFYFLPGEYLDGLSFININKICAIRLRVNQPVIVNGDGFNRYLSVKGLTKNKKDAIICCQNHIESIIESITERSLYAFNDKLKQGYLTTRDGVRVGIAGECVYDGDKIVTIKNVSSLNVRIPHEVNGCSNEVYEVIVNKINNDGQGSLCKINNTLLISPPTKGKTTILKDLAHKFNVTLDKNILIIDERQEFSSIYGENIDVIKNSSKIYSFNYAIRSMAPDIVITDELSNKDDWDCVKKASISGVNVIASCHGSGIDDVRKNDLFIKDVFDRYIVLDNGIKPGVIKCVYDCDFIKI